MSNTTIPRELLELISGKQHFIILGHTDPDGDCAASQLVTASFLRRLGKTAECMAEKPFTRHEIIPFSDLFNRNAPALDNPQAAAVISLDCSTLDRAAGYSEALEALPLIMIDHHASGRSFGTVRYLDAGAPSNTVLVFRLMKELGLQPTAEEAELLLFGLCTDTGFFRHLEEMAGDTLRAAAELSDAGASLKKVHAMVFGGRSLDTRMLLGKLLARTEAFFDGKVLYTHILREDLLKHGEEAKDSDTLYSLLQSVSGVVAVILVREETDGTLTAGIRTNHTVDAGRLAAEFAGGGHTRAAGLSSSLELSELKEVLVAAAGRMLSP